jgi:hypothetical protein
MSKRKILLLVLAAVNILFLPLVFIGALGILFGLFWHPMKQKVRIALVAAGGVAVLVAAWLSGALATIM